MGKLPKGCGEFFIIGKVLIETGCLSKRFALVQPGINGGQSYGPSTQEAAFS